MRRLAVMEAICAVKRLTAVGCLLASMLISVLWSAAAVAQNLTVADVEKIVSAAAQEASARGMPATITVVDRVGNSLAVFQMNGAPARVSVTSNRGIVAGNGLEKIEEIFAAFFAAANSPSGRLSAIAKAITGAKTILWNGPMGIFEDDRFAKGTMAVAVAVAAATGAGATSIIGGGDSVKALNKAGLGDQVTFMSTGGGASLKFLEGKELPGVAALTDK